MPESFHNRYTFPAGAVPVAEAFFDRLSRQFEQAFEPEKQERGFHGAPRAYACLRKAGMQIWIFWEADRAEVEVSVDEPMERMIVINAAIQSLGGKPQYSDESWRARRRYRTQRHILEVLVLAFALVLAVAVVWRLQWWGALLIVAVAVVGACLYVFGLARAFSNQ